MIKMANVVFLQILSTQIGREQPCKLCQQAITSACRLKSINTFVLHTQFIILLWILGTFVFNQIPIFKKSLYIFISFLDSSRQNYLPGLFVYKNSYVLHYSVYLHFSTVNIQDIVCDVYINFRLVFFYSQSLEYLQRK